MNYRFDLQEADLDSLSQCAANEAALRDWLESLPLANVGESARQVYVAAQELAVLDVSPHLRLDMLDVLRDTVHYLCESLAKHYLNQPPLLKDKQSKVASLCSALQNTMAGGYILCAVELSRHPYGKEKHQHIARAIHRAISDLSRILLRCFQIYADAPQHLWLHANQLYCMAEDLQVTANEVNDSQNRQIKKTSVEQAYKRILLLGASRPSQISQKVLRTIFDATEHWQSLIEIHPHAEQDDLLGINLQSDQAPGYLGDCDLDSGDWRSLNLEQLVEALAAHIESTSDGSNVKTRIELVPPTLALHFVDHLVATWSAKVDRLEQRRSADDPAQVCVGMTAVQYFLAGQVDFDVQMSGGVSMSGDERNPFLNRDKAQVTRTAINPDSDGWGQAVDAGHGGFGDIDVKKLEMILGASAVRKYKQEGIKKIADLAEEVPSQPLYHPRVINRSPAGCCLQWEEEASNRIQDGQLIALREAGEAAWRLGRICWMRLSGDNTLQTGIRFFANNGVACGAAVSYKERSRIEFMRAIELPEMAASGQPDMLVLPNVPFKADIKVFINRLGNTSKAMLGKPRLITSCFTLFEYRELDIGGGAEHADKAAQSEPDAPKPGRSQPTQEQPGDPFGNLWDEL